MTERDDVNLARWLDAEAGDAPDEADRLFAVVASAHLRRLEPSAGLADRILAALPGSAKERAFWPRLAWPVFDATSRWTKAAIFAATVLLGIGLAFISPSHVVRLVVETASIAAAALSDAAASLSAALRVWRASLDLMATLGQAAALVFTTGSMPVLIAANLAVASAAFVGLRRLLPPREECV